MCVAGIACQVFGLFDDNPVLQDTNLKIYSYLYIVLSLVFQEMTMQRLNKDYREALLHYERTANYTTDHVGKFEIRLQTVIMSTPQEIAECLTKPIVRMRWEHKLKTCTVTEDQWLSLKYENSSTDYLVKYTFLMEPSGSKYKNFLIIEDIVINRGLQNARKYYLLEEIANREGALRVRVFATVQGQVEARLLVKQLKSLRNCAHAADRDNFVVSCWNQISVYAAQQSGEEELIKKAKMKMAIIDEAFSSEDEDNLAQPTEIDDEEIIEAHNNRFSTRVINVSPASAPSQPLVEDLTVTPTVTSIIPITDSEWPKRMNDYNYNAKQRAYVERCRQANAFLFTFKDDAGWKSLIADPAHDVHMFYRDSARGLTCLKS